MMELVYLWVEEYKNIKKQGFNFSPRFKCDFFPEYDNEGRLKENCKLEITKNDDYVNIFPENINITAIVGENGSGKSSILEILHQFFSGNLFKKIFVIFVDDIEKDCLKLYSSDDFSLQTNINSEKIQHLIDYQNNDIFNNIHEVYYKNEKDHSFKSNISNAELNLDSENSSHIMKHLLKIFYFFKQMKFIDKNFFKLKTVSVFLEYDKLKKDIEIYNDNIQTKILELIKQLEYVQIDQKIIFNIVFEILDLKSDINNIKKPIVSLESFSFDMFKMYNKVEQYGYKLELKDILLNSLQLPPSQYRDPNHVFTIDIKDIEQNMFDFLVQLPSNEFKLKLYDEQDICFDSLSFGQKNLLITLGTIISLSKNMTYERDGIVSQEYEDEYGQINEIEQDVVYDTKIEKNYFLIDEYELGLHPEWHKSMINNMIPFFSILDKNIHIIITTHSPFILSDLPKENIIFLKDGKQVDVDIDTFGANIHTLLSHGFFMKDKGLMGEFAKEKIQDVINFLNNGESKIQSKEDAWKIIQIIGEPFLKYKLEEKFHENYSSDEVKNEAKIKRLEQELERLKNVKPKD